MAAIQVLSENFMEELMRTVKSIEAKVNVLSEKVNNDSQKLVGELKVLKEEIDEKIDKIDSRLDKAEESDYVINQKSNIGYLTRGKWIKVFSHNTSGGIFSSDEDARKKNPENPDANLYSILDQLESFRTPDGFHFKLCYPELNGCNLWIQTSNPVEEWNIQGFKPVHLSFQQNGHQTNWVGLGKNKNQWSAFIDDEPTDSYWWTAIGAKKFYPHNDSQTIPGPVGKSVQKVELWYFNFELNM